MLVYFLRDDPPIAQAWVPYTVRLALENTGLGPGGAVALDVTEVYDGMQWRPAAESRMHIVGPDLVAFLARASKHCAACLARTIATANLPAAPPPPPSTRFGVAPICNQGATAWVAGAAATLAAYTKAHWAATAWVAEHFPAMQGAVTRLLHRVATMHRPLRDLRIAAVYLGPVDRAELAPLWQLIDQYYAVHQRACGITTLARASVLNRGPALAVV